MILIFLKTLHLTNDHSWERTIGEYFFFCRKFHVLCSFYIILATKQFCSPLNGNKIISTNIIIDGEVFKEKFLITFFFCCYPFVKIPFHIHSKICGWWEPPKKRIFLTWKIFVDFFLNPILYSINCGLVGQWLHLPPLNPGRLLTFYLKWWFFIGVSAMFDGHYDWIKIALFEIELSHI